MSIELIDRGIMNTTRQGYTLNTNPVAGFKSAVNNGQTRLALEYAEVLIDQLMSRIAQLELRTASGESPDKVEEIVSDTKEKTTRQKKQTQEKEVAQEV